MCFSSRIGTPFSGKWLMLAGLAFLVDLEMGTSFDNFHVLGKLLVEIDLSRIYVIGAAVLIAVTFTILPDILYILYRRESM